MYSQNRSIRLERAVGPPRIAAGFVVALALLGAACNSDSKGLSALSGPNQSEPIQSESNYPSLETLPTFAVLANAAVTCTDGTITGNVGTLQAVPTGSVTLTGCPTTDTAHVGDSTAIQAYNAFLSRYDAIATTPCDVVLIGTLADVELAPGVYCFDGAATLAGVLTLNGPSNGTWIFRVGTSGTGALTGTGLSVAMAGGAQASNVTWQVTQATTMTDSHLVGTVLGGTAITLTRGTLDGNAWAKADVTITGTVLVGSNN